MCLECDGLGEMYSFDSDLLIPDTSKSFKQGCIELVGNWKEMGRWKRHIYQGVADTMEHRLKLDEGTLLDAPWEELDAKYQEWLLWGTGETHITFTWRGGAAGHKYGGTYEGVIPELLSKYGSSKSKMQIRQLEKYMSVIQCPDCFGQRLNPQARSVKIATAHQQFAERPAHTLPEICNLPISDAAEFFEQLLGEQVSFVDDQHESFPLGPQTAQTGSQIQPQFRLVAAAVFVAHFKQDGLQQRPPRREV